MSKRRVHRSAAALRPLLALAVAGAAWLQPACRGPAEPAPPPADAPAAALPLDPAIVHGTLSNGFSYFLRENGRPEQRALLWLVIDAGSMQEDEDQLGLAHFVEHMAFNGTAHFERDELVDFMESIGMQFGPDINAYTSFDETVYMLQVPTDDAKLMDRALLILEDWASGLTFDDEEIDKERGVVLEEWRLGQGAGSRIRDKQWPVLFRGSRYAERLPIGDEEIIQHAPHDALRRFYRDWYRPELMALVAVGDFDARAIERQVRERFSRLRGPEHPRKREIHPVPGHEETLFSVVTDPEMTGTRVTVYYKLDPEPMETAEDYRRELVANLHHAMLGARLNEIRQRPDPPFLFAGTSSGPMVRSRNVYSQFVAVPEGGALRGLDALLDEVMRVDRFGFTATELERQKKEILRAYEQIYRERDKERSSGLASELRDHFLEGEPAPGIELELVMVREMLPTITLDEVNHLAQSWIRDRDRVVLFSGPESPEAPPPAESELIAVLQRGRELEPWVDGARSGPLVAERPVPGTLVSENVIEEIGVTEWTLSNGVRVVLKPTDFRNDEVLLHGFSPGGTSLAPEAEDTTASVASSLLDAGGVGDFSAVELEKALAGTVAGADAFIGELDEQISGQASPEDLETMFELLWLRFTAPRLDQDAVASWIARQRAFLQNRGASPEVVFAEELGKALSQDHPRRQPWTVERLDEIDPQGALTFFRDRFADAGDFTFILVGNFDPEEIRGPVLTWLGGLPSAGRVEHWRDVGVRTPDGVVEVNVRKGLEPKSQVRIVFSGDATWDRLAIHDIVSLGAALRIRLREVLREDLGATYGVGAGGSVTRWPREMFQFTIAFGCAPENVDELVKATFETIEAWKRDGPGPDYLEKVTEAQVRRRETDLRENGFWLQVLDTYYRYGLDPRMILQYDDLVASVSRERLRDAARRYLPDDRYVIGILRPETDAVEAPAGTGR